jgi:hypothetical protein
MTDSSSPGLGLLLRKALRKASDSTDAEGEYSPLENARNLSLGNDHASRAARMVSFHETFHAILNGSTTFGNGMILAGALHAAGDPGYAELVERMISSALATHETYATLASIYSAAEGAYDRSLLIGYQDYLGLFDRVATVMELNDRPFIASVCVGSIARAAMQTTLLETWLDAPCEAWPRMVWTEDQTPDIRLDYLLQPAILDRARMAVEGALKRSAAPMARLAGERLSDEETRELLRRSGTGEQDKVSEAAFEIFSEILAAGGLPRPSFDAQRSQAQEIIARVVGYAGERLKTTFYVPENAEADRNAVLQDFRTERIVLRPARQLAQLGAIKDVDRESFSGFIRHREELRYLQLVALPAAKALRIYRPPPGGHAIAGVGECLTGVRRRLSSKLFKPAGLVEIVCLDVPQDLLIWKNEDPELKIHAIVSAKVLYETAWPKTWLTRESSRIDELAVLIDIDPFHLAKHLAGMATLQLNQARVHWEQNDEPEMSVPERLDVLVMTTDERPEIIHFTPCSGPLMDAIIDFAKRELPNVRIGGSLDSRQAKVLNLAISHVIREEPMFGFDFWTADAL